MINNKISTYGNTDLLNMALDATWKRNLVINENIANVDTPGYKRKDVKFEELLEKAVNRNGSRDSIANLKHLQPQVYTDNQNLSYRLDGNNVDIDTEMVNLAENQVRYNALIGQVNYNFERLKIVMG